MGIGRPPTARKDHMYCTYTKYITGFSIAKDIAESGGNVAVIDLRDSPLEDVYGLAEQFNVKVYYFPADVSNEASLTVSLMSYIKHRPKRGYCMCFVF